jgi:RimJ/RimL family protein N-acetyltransferase
MSMPQPARGRPERQVIEGRYVRLEPLGHEHAGDLWAASSDADAGERYRYLFVPAPATREEMDARIVRSLSETDPLAFAVIDLATGRAGGQQSFMRIVPEHGVIEIGAIYWGPGIARTRLATEALYLFARHSFEALGYRRFEWKCNDRNEPSKRAAQRFGFTYEGTFRQHMIIKGENRDTAWFSMLDGEWPALKAEYERWLAPENFDADGLQKTALRVR